MKFSSHAAANLATGSYHWSPTNLLRRFLPITITNGGSATSTITNGGGTTSANANGGTTSANANGGGTFANTNRGGTVAITGAATSANTNVGTVASRELVVYVLVPNDGSGESVVGTKDGSFRNNNTKTSVGTKDGSLPGGGIGVTENKLIMFTRDNTKTSVGQGALQVWAVDSDSDGSINVYDVVILVPADGVQMPRVPCVKPVTVDAIPTVPPSACAFKFFKQGCPGMTHVFWLFACFLVFVVQPAYCMDADTSSASSDATPVQGWTLAMWLTLLRIIKDSLFAPKRAGHNVPAVIKEHGDVPVKVPTDSVGSEAWKTFDEKMIAHLTAAPSAETIKKVLKDMNLLDEFKELSGWKQDSTFLQNMRVAKKLLYNIDSDTHNFIALEKSGRPVPTSLFANACYHLRLYPGRPHKAYLYLVNPAMLEEEFVESIRNDERYLVEIKVSKDVTMVAPSLMTSGFDFTDASIKLEEDLEASSAPKEASWYELCQELSQENRRVHVENTKLEAMIVEKDDLLSVLEGEKGDLQQEQEVLRQEIDTHKGHRERTQDLLDVTTRELSELRVRYSRLQEESRTQSLRKDDMIANLQHELAIKESSLEQSNRTAEIYRETCDQLEVDCAELQDKVDDLQDASDELESTIHSLRTTKDRLEFDDNMNKKTIGELNDSISKKDTELKDSISKKDTELERVNKKNMTSSSGHIFTLFVIFALIVFERFATIFATLVRNAGPALLNRWVATQIHLLFEAFSILILGVLPFCICVQMHRLLQTDIVSIKRFLELGLGMKDSCQELILCFVVKRYEAPMTPRQQTFWDETRNFIVFLFDACEFVATSVVAGWKTGYSTCHGVFESAVAVELQPMRGYFFGAVVLGLVYLFMWVAGATGSFYSAFVGTLLLGSVLGLVIRSAAEIRFRI